MAERGAQGRGNVPIPFSGRRIHIGRTTATVSPVDLEGGATDRDLAADPGELHLLRAQHLPQLPAEGGLHARPALVAGLLAGLATPPAAPLAEEELLGDAGAVKNAARMIDAPALFVFNGDSLVGLDVNAMWDFHHSRRALATVALVALDRTSRYRRVVTDDNCAVTAFHDRQSDSDPSENGKSLVNTGAYLLSRQFIDLIPDERPVSMEDEMLPMLVGSGLYGFVTNGLFLDIGVPDDLARAQHELPMRWKV